MKKLTFITVSLLVVAGLLSCKKEHSCEKCIGNNRPPVACAGADRTITLPTDTITLDGSCSTDPDNNITSYSWTKITGPSSFSIANANAATTQVSYLTEGVYQFELKVTDAGGLFSKDTVQVTVSPASSNSCDANRPQVNAQLIPIGTLSEPRYGMAVASAGNKILFTGGYSTDSTGSASVSTRVDIFDFAANTWSTAELNLGRRHMAAVGAGNKIFFAGGNDDDDVDIYDVTTNTWSLSRLLMQYGNSLAAAAVGNKVFFAGGNHGDYPSSSVDIYDLTTNTWSTASLSAPRNYLTANSANNKVYFTGGYAGQTSNVIDIYDNITGGWSTSYLLVPRAGHAAIAVNDVLYSAGGAYSDGQPTCSSVETWNINTGARTLMYLSSPAPGFLKAVAINNKLLFFDDGGATESRLDMYDIATNTWSIVVLPVPLEEASIISVNNTIYVAGGMVNGVLSNQVWKLEF